MPRPRQFRVHRTPALRRWDAACQAAAGLAWQGGAAYAGNAVKEPFINVEEKIDRFVGRRTKTPDGWKAGMQIQASGLQLHKSFKHRWLAGGVHRFKTHEEADTWMIKMLARGAR